MNTTNVLLEPLAPDESRELIEALVEAEEIDAGLRDRILESAAGNPLFVEEMVAMIAEHDRPDVTVPPTIHALLAARLDQLDTAERSVLERGSVEGQVFHRGAVVALALAEHPSTGGSSLSSARTSSVPSGPSSPTTRRSAFAIS